MTARLGLGTYRCLDVAEAALMAASSGAGWVDTAPNYAVGRAEMSLAVVLAAYPDLCVSTKVGFVPAGAGHIGVRAGALSPADAEGGHCLTPDYITWQLARSRLMLGRVPDLVFVHNPEHSCPDGEITGRLSNAFLALEEACSQQIISAYGVATWRGFSSGLFDVPTLIELATKAGGPDHHLWAIQLPVSLVHLAPVAQALDGHGPLADALAAGLEVFASAPLHGGEIPGLVPPELSELITPGKTPAETALAVVASAPGVKRVLLSTGNPEHWMRAAEAVGQPPLSPDVLRRVVDVLGT
ncbi:aryl-alcohol dehydrogenase-like predicted oxidoreductase [Kitasatospora sp. MAA19]|uniref:aldo/keto reductase n=1 Tax=unclassified Kitasatospora TaxID=2633591 RepID=UPI0024767F15|nr:aldo/keto reductase [Kitasatospora sp. MAA19]MDH6704812.1 aryl-alcohol dehydrogenase-like predicted oxidoreductase [Kitasatospora sp. MAA19]